MKGKKLLPHLTAIGLFLAISFAYFSPMLEGKKLDQPDIKNWAGAAREAIHYKNTTGEESFWTNSMFGGMPTYLINNPDVPSIFQKIHKTINKPGFRPACHLFLYMLGFYLALLAFGVNPWLSIAGAFAYGFSSYFLIIITAGHVTKAIALGYLPAIIGGIYLSYKRKMLVGAALMAVFLSFQLFTNHLQITYYTLMVVIALVIAEFTQSILEKRVLQFVKISVVLFLAAMLAVGSTFTSLYLIYDYGKDSMRGKTELTSEKENRTGGLDKDYATSWSYGKAETLTLIIPNFAGGESGGALTTKSETYKTLADNYGAPQAKRMIEQLPLYWGPQPFTSGPVYVGAIIAFLFVLGLFIIRGSLKWWIVAVTILSVLLAWGKNFMPLTDFFLDYIPGYNKFRTVSMILVIAQFTIPLMAILGLQQILNNKIELKEFKRALIWSLGIVGGLCLLFAMFAGAFFDFSSPSDAQYANTWIPMEALMADRQWLLQADAWRSLLFILLTAGALVLFYYKKLETKWFFVALSILILVDMWPIAKRYLNENNFKNARTAKEHFTATKADQYILKDSDPNFRVLNLSVSTFNDASTSYFHKSIGGYHGAKMKRYQELIDHNISVEIQSLIKTFNSKQGMDSIYAAMEKLGVINMLNTKYIIYSPENPPLINTQAYGNAWFVKRYQVVSNADAEIKVMENFDPSVEAIVDKRFKHYLENFQLIDNPNASIRLTDYKPNYMQYKFSGSTEQFTVFSEIYYNKGWQAFIDQKPVDHFRVNYVLRAMLIPAGEHTVEFKFEPESLKWANPITLVSSFLLLLLVIGVVYYEVKNKTTKA